MALTATSDPPFSNLGRRVNKMDPMIQKGYFNFCPTESWAPNVNLYETDHAYVVCVDLAGVDLAGLPAAGYDVRYIDPPYRADGSGDALFVAGGAVLQVVVRAPAYDTNGNATVPWGGPGTVIIRPDQFDARGFTTFEDLVWGGSFEGQSSFGLGVRARLPFRVFQLDGPGDGTRLVVDVAHRW